MLNRVCTSCPSGWTSVYGETKCDECTQGKFVNQLVCDSCGAGMYGTPNLKAKERTKICVQEILNVLEEIPDLKVQGNILLDKIEYYQGVLMEVDML